MFMPFLAAAAIAATFAQLGAMSVQISLLTGAPLLQWLAVTSSLQIRHTQKNASESKQSLRRSGR